MRGSFNVVGGWKEERTGVAFVDMLKPEGGGTHRASVASKMRPHPLMELLPPQMPVWAGWQSAEE